MERPSEWVSEQTKEWTIGGGYIHFRLKLMANLTDCLISNYCSAELPLLPLLMLLLLELRLRLRLLPHTGAPFKLAIFLFLLHCDWLTLHSAKSTEAPKRSNNTGTHWATLSTTQTHTHTHNSQFSTSAHSSQQNCAHTEKVNRTPECHNKKAAADAKTQIFRRRQWH